MLSLKVCSGEKNRDVLGEFKDRAIDNMINEFRWACLDFMSLVIVIVIVNRSQRWRVMKDLRP